MNGNGKLIVIEGPSGSGKTTLHERIVAEFKRREIKLIETAEPTKAETRLNYLGIAIRKLIERNELTDEDIEKVRSSARALCVGEDSDEVLIHQRKPFQLRFSETVGKIINRRKLTELDRQLLFIADRWFHLTETVGPADASGTWILMDRYELSTDIHYRMKTGSTTDFLGRWQYPLLGPAYVRPGFVFILKVSAKTAFERQKASGKILDMYEQKLDQMKELVREYDRAIARFKHVSHKDPRYKYPFIILDAEQSADQVFEQAISKISLLPTAP